MPSLNTSTMVVLILTWLALLAFRQGAADPAKSVPKASTEDRTGKLCKGESSSAEFGYLRISLQICDALTASYCG